MLGPCGSNPVLRSLRQHVNPLSSFFQQERPLPGLAELFAIPEQPLHLDIGCARGKFLLQMASQTPQRNHLGLEIRHPLVKQAEAERLQLELTNLHFLFCNANISLRQLVGSSCPLGNWSWSPFSTPTPGSKSGIKNGAWCSPSSSAGWLQRWHQGLSSFCRAMCPM